MLSGNHDAHTARRRKFGASAVINAVLAGILIYWASNYTLLGFVEEEYHFPRDIWEAARSGSTWQIGKFLARGAKVNARDDMGHTPLLWTANRNKLPAAKYLISRGADLNVNYYDETPLTDALMKRNERMVALLLDHGASVKTRDKIGRTPLIFLLSSSYIREDFRLVKLLVEHGADVNARDKYKSSPLGYAQKYHYDEIADYLRAHGAKG